MATRRQVLGAGAAASLLPASAAIAAAKTPDPAIYRAVYDARHPEARGFAEEAARRGWPVRAIEGDVTGLWFHELDLRWKEGPAAICGLTEPAALFILERLAWDAGMRVTARADHPNGRLVSWVIGPRSGRRAA